MAELDIPESWCKTEIGRVFTIVGGTTPKANVRAYFCDEGGKPWVTPADFSELTGSYISRGRRNITLEGEKSCSLRMLPEGSVLYSSRAPIGHCAIASNPIFTNQGFKSLSYNPLVDSKFTLHYMRFITPIIEGMASGTTFKEVSGSVLSKVPFLLPPLAEQKRIVAKIESTTAKIDAIEKAVSEAEALLEKYRESLLAKAFRGELVPQDPNDEPASKLLDRIREERATQQSGKKQKAEDLPPISEDEIPFEIPKSWEWVRLGEICSLKNGFAYKSTDFQSSGIPVVRISNVTSTGVDLSDCVFVSEGFLDNRFTIRRGDILIAMSGATTGKFGKYLDDTPALLNQRVGNLRLILTEACIVDFRDLLVKWLSKNILEAAYGGAQPNISGSMIENMIVPLPPVQEQARLCNALVASEVSARRIESNVQALEGMLDEERKAILNQAFSGCLVPQDPSEGTGHELLAEITRLKHIEPKNKSSGKKNRTPRVQP